MGTKFPVIGAIGFNASAPSDDGAHTLANKITWNNSVLAKVGNPLKTYIDAVNAAIVTALDTIPTSSASAYTTTPSDNIKPIQVTGTTTISLGDAASMGAGYQATIVNVGVGVVTVTPITGTDTLNSVAGGSVAVPINGSMTFTVNAGANGYFTTAAVTTHVDAEVPTGVINGVGTTGNKVFTLAFAPSPPESLVVFHKDGPPYMAYGIDFTLAGTTMTFNAASTPQNGDLIRCFYRY